MKYALLFTGVFTILSLTQCKIDKLIIKTEDDKYTIKENMSIAVTAKGEAYPFNKECKSTCKECDPLYANSRWKIDSIQETRLVLKNELTFVYDTIPQSEFKRRSKHDKKTNLIRVLSIEKRAFYVYKIPVDIEYKTVYYDSLSMITYSYKDKCYRGGPFQRMFADPNKIRRVAMEGCEVKVVYK